MYCVLFLLQTFETDDADGDGSRYFSFEAEPDAEAMDVGESKVGDEAVTQTTESSSEGTYCLCV